MMRFKYFFLSVLLCLNVACNKAPILPEKKVTLNVVSFLYGDLALTLQAYQFLNPYVEINYRQINSLDEKKIEEGMKQADVVLCPPSIYRKYIKQNYWKTLHTLEKTLQWKDYDSRLKKMLIRLGDGEISAVTPSFSSQAILCNQTLFEKANILIPKKRMSWEEFFKLSEQLTKKLQMPAFTFSQFSMRTDASYFVYLYADVLGLQAFHPQSGKLSVINEGWKKVWGKTIELAKEKVITNPSQEPITDFSEGQIPMAIFDSNMYKANKQFIGHAFKLQIIPMPYSKENSEGNVGIQPSRLYAIPAKSAEPDEAEKFLSFIMSDNYAKNLENDYTISTRNKDFPERETFLAGEFVSVKDLPESVEIKLAEEMNPFLIEAFQGKKTIDQALKEWDQKLGGMTR